MTALDSTRERGDLSSTRTGGDDERGFFEALWQLLMGALRPARGWLALAGALTLTLLPIYPLTEANFVRTDASARLLTTAAIMSVLATWLLIGYGRNRFAPRLPWVQAGAIALALAWLGAVVISAIVIGWLPGVGMLWRALVGWRADEVLNHLQLALDTLGARVALWQVGGSNPGSDELVVATALATLLWGTGALAAALCRAGKSGIAIALPSLALTGAVALASGTGRWTFLGGIGVALALSLALDNGRLLERWVGQRLDFNAEVLIERWMNALAIGAVALGLAAGIASISLASISDFVARMLNPVTETIESAGESAFPEVTFTDRTDRGDEQGDEGPARITGLPNEFLLGAGPAPSATRLLELRTSDTPIGDSPPRAPYLFSRAYSEYVGTGWTPEPFDDRERLVPNERRASAPIIGRRLLAQSIVRIADVQPAPFAADIAETGVQAVLDLDTRGQPIRMNTAARNYAVLSTVPAMSAEEFAALPPWGAAQTPLPAGFDKYLALPESVTERTRALAGELTDGIESPYLRAAAIEEYLRTFPYDLGISAPPEEVTDVADYFLFELQRGYCDYFATAFVVLARAAGLPTRFVAGYAPGDWQVDDRYFLITANKSHAWPEVYLPRIGWVAFEPTSGLAPLERIGAAQAYLAPTAPPLPQQPVQEPDFVWNWQMLFWLVPIALIFWIITAIIGDIRRRREDPWLGLMRWGARRGRPLQPWETPKEYATAIAEMAGVLGEGKPETAHTVQRATVALGDAVARARYATEEEKGAAVAEVVQEWRKMRDLLRYLR